MKRWAPALFLLTMAGQPSPQKAAVPVTGPYPFAVGEKFTYAAKLGLLTLGRGELTVAQLDTVAGTQTYLFRFTLEGGTFFFKIKSTLESWAGTSDLVSHRFQFTSNENDRVYKHRYNIFPDSGLYREEGKDQSGETPPDPLDEMAFFYFVRVTPLEVGKTYEYPRYFKKDINPVVIRVLKREKKELPSGEKVDCLLLNPVVGDRGFFSSRSDAKVWLTDDARRIPVVVRTRQPFGVLTLELTDISAGGSSPATDTSGSTP
jgi:hypothetical protein